MCRPITPRPQRFPPSISFGGCFRVGNGFPSHHAAPLAHPRHLPPSKSSRGMIEHGKWLPLPSRGSPGSSRCLSLAKSPGITWLSSHPRRSFPQNHLGSHGSPGSYRRLSPSISSIPGASPPQNRPGRQPSVGNTCSSVGLQGPYQALLSADGIAISSLG